MIGGTICQLKRSTKRVHVSVKNGIIKGFRPLESSKDIGPRSGAFPTMYKTLLSIPGLIKNPVISNASTGGPSSLQERGPDSCLRAVLCYKRF